MAFAPAQAAGFAISGTVTGEGASALEGVSVELQSYDVQDEYFTSEDWVETDENGAYEFAEVEAGATYRVRVHSFENFARTDSTTFTLDSNKLVPAVQLLIGGTLSGSVHESGTNALIEYADVQAFQIKDGIADQDNGFQASIDPDDGSFVLQGLPVGSYKVQISDFDGNHVKEFYNNAPNLASAETIAVTKNGTRGLGAITLDVGGRFTGTVLDETENPIEFASVSALPIVDGEADYSNAFGARIDEVTGEYSIERLPAGAYKIVFSGPVHFEQFHNSKATLETATTMNLALGQTVALGTTILEQTAAIGGAIEDSAGNPLEDMGVEAFKVTGGVVASEVSGYAYTDSDGLYEISPLHAGTYRLRFFDGNHKYADKSSGFVIIEGGAPFDFGTTVMVKKPVVVKPAPKKAATVKVSGKGAKKKATLTITVKASGVTPTGKVKILLGSKTLKTVTLKRGKATVTLTKQKKGKRAYKVIYSGDSKVLAKSVTTKKITIK